MHSGSHNYTEFAYQFLSMIIVSPLSSHNIYLLWPIVFIPTKRKKENALESQGSVELKMQHYLSTEVHNTVV